MTEPHRAEAMARRLARTARRLGLDAAGAELVLRAYRAAMEPRLDRIREDHHPDYLHPARTALILMDDAGVADPRLLAAALLTETRDPSLAATPETIAALDPDVATLVDRVPLPGNEAERLMETLLALPPGPIRLAAAERLDHARHLHLRDRAEWDPYHSVTLEVYAPVTARVDATLGARLDWWCDMFARRFLAV